MLVWTLVDNFEWEMGTRPTFGHYTFDRRRKSALLRPFRAFARRLGAGRLGAGRLGDEPSTLLNEEHHHT